MSFKLRKYGVDFGQLTQRIAIYNIAVSPDIIGGEVTNKTLFAERWARVELKTERQSMSGQISQDKTEIMVHLRYFTGVRKQMQVKFNDEFYEIQSVQNLDEADLWLRVLALKSEGE